MTYDFTHPTWKQVGDMQNEIDELHAENALKLTQILDLEQLIYSLRGWEDEDGILGPCWLMDGCKWKKERGHLELHHALECIKARQATEPFWKKPA